MNNTNNPLNHQSFADSFENIHENLRIRYDINMHLDFINEFIKFADNTRDIVLLTDIRNEIHLLQNIILSRINTYENERNNKENSN